MTPFSGTSRRSSCLKKLVLFMFYVNCLLPRVESFAQGGAIMLQRDGREDSMYCGRRDVRDRMPMHMTVMCNGACSPQEGRSPFTVVVQDRSYRNAVAVSIVSNGPPIRGFTIVAVNEDSNIVGDWETVPGFPIATGSCRFRDRLEEQTALHVQPGTSPVHEFRWISNGRHYGDIQFVAWVVLNHRTFWLIESHWLRSERSPGEKLGLPQHFYKIVKDVFEVRPVFDEDETTVVGFESNSNGTELETGPVNGTFITEEGNTVYTLEAFETRFDDRLKGGFNLDEPFNEFERNSFRPVDFEVHELGEEHFDPFNGRPFVPSRRPPPRTRNPTQPFNFGNPFGNMFGQFGGQGFPPGFGGQGGPQGFPFGQGNFGGQQGPFGGAGGQPGGFPGQRPGQRPGPGFGQGMPGFGQGTPGGAQPGMPGFGQGMPGGAGPGFGQGMPGGIQPGAPGARPGFGQGMPGGAGPGFGQGMPGGGLPGMPGARPGFGQGMPGGGMPGARPGFGQGMPGGGFPGAGPGFGQGMPGGGLPGMPGARPGFGQGMPGGGMPGAGPGFGQGMPGGGLPGIGQGMPGGGLPGAGPGFGQGMPGGGLPGIGQGMPGGGLPGAGPGFGQGMPGGGLPGMPGGAPGGGAGGRASIFSLIRQMG